MKNLLTICAVMALGSLTAFAEGNDTQKISVTPTGRILMDGAVYMGGNSKISDETPDTKFVNGVAIPDLRLGVKARYGKWKAKVDVGFAYGKVGLKDTYLEYDFNESNLVRAGYFVPEWGLNSETSSSMKQTYEEPTSNEFFNANPRLLAAMWVFDKGQFYTGNTIFAEANAMKQNATEMGKQAWGAQTRLVWRPRHADGDVIQVGSSFNYSSPNADDHSGFDYSANFPSRVSKVPLLKAAVGDARGLFKLSPELLVIKGNVALEAQYYFMNISRKEGRRSYTAHGAYGMVRTLLIGSRYTYSHGDAGVATPAKGSLELVGCYNYTDGSDRRAAVMGGVMHDVSCTLNYYINSWMLTRLRYSYTTVNDRDVEGLLPKRHVNILEARVQIIF